MVEAIIHTLLSGIGISAQPTSPVENSSLPITTYTVTDCQPELNLVGSAGMVLCVVQIDHYADNADSVLSRMATVYAGLHLYTSGTVPLIWLTSQSTTQEEYGHHGQQNFSVWVRE